MGLSLYKSLLLIVLRAALAGLAFADPENSGKVRRWLEAAIRILEGLPLAEAQELKLAAYEAATELGIEDQLHEIVYQAGLSSSAAPKPPTA